MKSCLKTLLIFLFIVIGLPLGLAKLFELKAGTAVIFSLIGLAIFLSWWLKKTTNNNEIENIPTYYEPRKVVKRLGGLQIRENDRQYKKRIALQKLDNVLCETEEFCNDMKNLQ
ncbi:MAG: hypothetical protein LBN27_08540 [Prevotellaceae bacterium]|jgi:hypothetical protein|nr:hypothetical protein [Prevotellaceae bacterium]